MHSLDSLSTSISNGNSIPSYADQQLAHERAEAARQAEDREYHHQHNHHGRHNHQEKQAEKEAKDFARKSQDELKRLEKQAGKKYEEFSAEAKEGYQKWKKEAQKGAKEAEKEAKKGGRWLDENKGNPVVVANAVTIAAVGAFIGVGAYRLQQRGELTWKVASAWAGVAGLFAVGDYYISQ